MILPTRRHDGRLIDQADKSFPSSAHGRSIAEFVGRNPVLDEFATPLLVVDADALNHNLEVMADWVAARGLELMPHGKTTMAPALWARQLDAGATGITVATPWQAMVALASGVPFVMLANEGVDPVGMGWIVEHLRTHPEQSLACWADSTEAVQLLEDTLVRLHATRPLNILVELGGAGGRTGARTVDAALAIADRIAASPQLTLLGVAGYEGAIGHDRSPDAIRRIRAYLETLAELLARLGTRLGTDRPVISAGGSAFFDVVADTLGELADGRSRVVLRSGAYLTHDSGFYESISPLGASAVAGSPRLAAATWGLARVLSRPERGLVLLDGGKRDFPYDEGLPVVTGWRATPGGSEQPLPASPVHAMNDQHSFLKVDGPQPPVGSVVRLGLSHPCTTFDKWRLIPVLASGVVVDVIETCF